jgi:hypothetical protein
MDQSLDGNRTQWHVRTGRLNGLDGRLHQRNHVRLLHDLPIALSKMSTRLLLAKKLVPSLTGRAFKHPTLYIGGTHREIKTSTMAF